MTNHTAGATVAAEWWGEEAVVPHRPRPAGAADIRPSSGMRPAGGFAVVDASAKAVLAIDASVRRTLRVVENAPTNVPGQRT